MKQKVKSFSNKLDDIISLHPIGFIMAVTAIVILVFLFSDIIELKVIAIIMLAFFIGPVLVFGGWFIVLVAQSGASIYAIILLIAFCLYVDSLLTNYGLLGGLFALWFFKR